MDCCSRECVEEALLYTDEAESTPTKVGRRQGCCRDTLARE
jgi:hypothetical protein